MATDITSKPVPDYSYEVAKRNLEDLDKFENQLSGTVTFRNENVVRPLPVLVDEFESIIAEAASALPAIAAVADAADNAIAVEIPAQIDRLGLEYPPIPYTAGLTLNSHTKTYSYLGALYIWGGTIGTITTGAFDEDGWQPIQGDIQLRNDVTKGTSLIRDVKHVASVAALRLLAGEYDGQVVSLTSYYDGTNKGGGDFVWDADSTATDDGGVTFAVTGVATGRWVRFVRNREISVHDYGAGVSNGLQEEGSQIIAARDYAYSNQMILLVPAGSYLYLGTLYNIESDYRLHKGTFSGGVNVLGAARGTKYQILAETPDVSPQDRANNRTCMNVTVTAKGSSHGTGIRSNLNNYSDDGEGNTAFYGNAVSTPGCFWSAAVHGETRHGGGTSISINAEAYGYSSMGSLYGIVVNQTTNPAFTHEITGASGDLPAIATGIYVTGNGLSSQLSAWRAGIDFNPNSIRSDGNAIRIQTNGRSGLRFPTTAQHNIADVFSESNSVHGIVLDGNYSGSALRVKDGKKISFRQDGSANVFYDAATDRIVFNHNASQPLRMTSVNIIEAVATRPQLDNTYNLGGSTFRWAQLYAASGTINTSDEREKTELLDYEAAEKSAALEIKKHIRKFKFIDAVNKKGDAARIHFGVGAQTVKSILEKHGLNPFEYAFLCYDEWEELPEIKETVDDKEVVVQEYRAAGNRYGIRYDELAMFILGAL